MKSHFRKHSPLRDTRFIVAVGSGKGGVGKTTMSLLLSLALMQEGYKVGVYDLDFYGPNVHILLSGPTLMPYKDAEGFRPAEFRGMKLMSLSFLVSEREPIFMRGPLAGKLLQELTSRVVWGPLDFLVLDLPPGTGDIFLEMIKLFSPDAFVLISTPHRLSISDARRVINLLKAEEIPVLGVIENMGDLYGKEGEFSQFLKENGLYLIYKMPFSQKLAQAESVETLLEEEDFKVLLKDLADKFLKRMFRIH